MVIGMHDENNQKIFMHGSLDVISGWILIYIGYLFDEVYYKNLKPRLLDKMSEYHEVFKSFLYNKEVRSWL